MILSIYRGIWTRFHRSVKSIAMAFGPCVQGGQQNHGFEYLGLDIMLTRDRSILLEINAPPSQDSATQLPHAEAVHDAVLIDWIGLWVDPHIRKTIPLCGGVVFLRCVQSLHLQSAPLGIS